MKIVIGIVLSQDGTPVGVEFLDMDPAAPKQSTTAAFGGQLMNSSDVVTALNNDVVKQAQAGFAALCGIPGFPAGTTKWQALVAQCNDVSAPANLKALNLK